MLRLLVVLLLLANALVLVWSQGWLGGLLPAPGQGQRESARLERQVRPETVRVFTPQAASAALAQAAQAASAPADAASASGAAASEPAALAPAGAASATSAPASVAAVPACLEAGPLAATELAPTERNLREAFTADKLPPPRWTTVRTERGGVFIVAMGRYPDRNQLQKKAEELRRMGVPYQEIADSPSLSPGLQLGPRFDDRQAASAALADYARKGVKSARVAALVNPVPVAFLRVNQPDAGAAEKLQSLELPPGAARFKACTKA
jgi:hypothetical protein